MLHRHRCKQQQHRIHLVEDDEPLYLRYEHRNNCNQRKLNSEKIEFSIYPSGCPILTAPPYGFTLDGSRQSLLILAIPIVLNASFNSQCDISDLFNPAFFKS